LKTKRTKGDPAAFEALLGRVEKPGRYLGNERGAVRKDPEGVSLRFALAFPEVYEIAQSHPGLQILYDRLNARQDVYAERVYAPWLDLERLLRDQELPLVSLETFTPLGHFDIVGFSLQYELTYTNLLTMLDLGGIPLRSAEREVEDPIVIAGGPCAFNPEPLAEFLDAVLLGDGEEAIYDICDAVLAWDRHDRGDLLEALSRIEGMYVPSFYEPEYSRAGRLVGVHPRKAGVAERVRKRVVCDLDALPAQRIYVVPTMKTVHARPSLEVMRGCVKGCRFCQAGYVYRPLRERDPRAVLEHAEQVLAATGADEISLLSLSTGDYSCINPLLTRLMDRFVARQVALSLPSTRVDALAGPILEQIRRVRKTGFTLAPEAGTQRLRDFIQKEFSEDELLEAARQVFALGWRSLKLYFMLGLPGEREEDLLGIAELSARVAAAGKRGAEVTASVSTFVPRPHTPLQWAAQIDCEETERRQAFLRRELRRRRIRFKWHDAGASFLEGVFARGDRRLGSLLVAAYRLGCRFDGWTEACRLDLWERAMHETGIDPRDYLGQRAREECLPWDHLDGGVEKKFLARELERAEQGTPTPDCSVDRCTYCGVCDFLRRRNVDYHVAGARGSEHRGARIEDWARNVMGTADATPGSWEPRGWHKIRSRQAASTRAISPSENGSPGARHPNVPHEDRACSPLPGGNAGTAPGGWQPSSEDRDSTLQRKPGLGTAEEWLSANGEGLAAAGVRSADAPVIRVRITYRKVNRARFIGHLDLIAVFTSAFRRSRLPIAFSKGHRPMPRFRFSPGLPVGCESECEVLDVDFTRPFHPDAVARALAEELPEGLSVVAARAVSRNGPPVEAELTGMRYRIELGEIGNGNGEAWIDERLADFARSETFLVRKRTGKGEREVDARALVARLERIDARHLEMDLRFDIAGSVKPSDVLATLFELDVATARALPIRKTRCFYRGDALQPGDPDGIGSRK